MGVSPLWFLRWAPLVLNLSYLLPLKVIANVTLRSERARWLVLPLFLAGNWIDQDYFSPQGVDFFLYLVVIAVLLKSFSSRGSQPATVRRIIFFTPLRSQHAFSSDISRWSARGHFQPRYLPRRRDAPCLRPCMA